MQDHVEAVLVWSDRGPSGAVDRWLKAHGLGVQKMKAGLLVSGPRDRFQQAFGVPPQAPANLPVPAELAPHVASIAVPAPRRREEDERA